MTKHANKNGDGADDHRDEEVRYLAEKMGVSIDEMRRILADSSMSAEELERELLKPKPVEN